MAEETSSMDTKSILFKQLVLSFQASAMQQMGKLMNPFTQKIERNMSQAQMSIDMLDMLKEKTKGNLTEEEARLIEGVLFELRMNYVDEVEKDKKKAEEEKREAERKEEKAGEKVAQTKEELKEKKAKRPTAKARKKKRESKAKES
ncbi:MAG: DUF1844 domain-containing protein [bacterium]